MTPKIVHDAVLMLADDANMCRNGDSVMRRWQRIGLILFACVTAASVDTSFAGFVRLIVCALGSRTALCLRAAGRFALAVLIMGQFVHWSRLACLSIKERR